MASQPAVYMLASKQNGTIYIGVTGNLVERIWQHRNESTQGFTQKYRVRTLAYYEIHNEMSEAILSAYCQLSCSTGKGVRNHRGIRTKTKESEKVE